MGSFDFDQTTKKPIYLKNKYGQLTDNYYRSINQKGYLINARGDIIDHNGHIKFQKE